MRIYREENRSQPEKVYCNCCGKELKVKDGMIMEGVFSGTVTWGYFSEKDGESHSFDLCEGCYDKWTAAFQLPPEKKTETELF